MFKSIKARLTVTICGILLILFIIQMAANFLLAEKYYVFQKTKMMKDINRQIQEQAGTTEEDIIYAIRTLVFDNGLEILLTDTNFNLIYSNRTFNPEIARQINPQIDQKLSPNTMPQADIQADPRSDLRSDFTDFDFEKYPKSYYKADEPTIIKTNMKDGDRIRLLSKIVQGENTYYLVIRLSVKSISSDMKSTNLFVLYISSFAIIMGSLIVYVIAKQFTKPIEDINKVAIKISNLDFSLRSRDINRKDEIGSLARNINNMSDRLERNIQSLQEANKKLEIDNKYMSEVDEQRKELIANISHELKTPLAILTGYTEMLSNDIPGIDKAFYYETIQDETRKMDILIKNLLNLSDFENRLLNLNMEKINPMELAERIYRKNKLLMEHKEIVGEFYSQPCPVIIADPLYMEVALNNYIANAISYTKKGHKIIIRIKPEGDEVILTVYNEGSHIDEEHMDKIWNSFYREDKSRKRTSQNNIGLGLYIVRSIMNAHHGKYGVRNKDNGVEFWLSFQIDRGPEHGMD